MILRAVIPVSVIALFPQLIPGQTPDAGPREIVQRSLRFETLFAIFDLAPPPDYLCQIDMTLRNLDKTDQLRHIGNTWEAMTFYGDTFLRLIRKDGRELPPDKARTEQMRFDKAIEKRAHATPEARAKAEQKFQAERDACRDEFMRIFDFRMAGTEIIADRPSWVVEASPLPNRGVRCGDLKTLSKFHLRIWIDRAEFRWARLEGDNIVPVTGYLWPGRQSAGQLHVTSEQTRYGEGLWLRTREQEKTHVKMLMLSFPAEFTVTFSGYRKFQADSRLLLEDGK